MIFFLQNSGACWNLSGLSWFPSVKPRQPDSSAPCWTSSSTWRRPRGRRWSCVSNASSGPRQRREPSYDKLWRYEGHKQKRLVVTNSTSATCDQQKVAFWSTFRDFLGRNSIFLEQRTTPPPVFQMPLSHSCLSAGVFVVSQFCCYTTQTLTNDSWNKQKRSLRFGWDWFLKPSDSRSGRRFHFRLEVVKHEASVVVSL